MFKQTGRKKEKRFFEIYTQYFFILD